MKVDREFVTWCYRIILGREPESEPAVNNKLNSGLDRSAMVTNFILSNEFMTQNPRFANAREWVWAELDGALLRVNLSDRMVSYGIISRNYEKAETQFLRSNVKKGDIVADIGANIGYYTIVLASIVGPTGRVYSFEPLPDMFETLELSIRRNGFESRVIAHNVAISDRGGAIPMFHDSTSIVDYGAQIVSGQDNRPGASLIEVPTGRLSDFIPDPKLDFIKIDVEGAEQIVLGGSLDLLERCHPVILSEINVKQLQSVSNRTPSDYVRLLSSVGYKGRALNQDGSLGPAVNPDAISGVVNVVFVCD
jgi:FkbM family methyltransferase